MEVLKEQRRVRRINATKSCEALESKFKTLDFHTKVQYITRLECLKSELKELDAKIFHLMIENKSTEEENNTEYERCCEYENRLIQALTALKISTEEARFKSNTAESKGGINQIKLPEIPLPQFSNKFGDDLGKFLANFEQIISKYTLTEYEKFVYLQRQLSGDPLTLVKSLELDAQTFESAKTLLEKAFASKITQKFNAIEKLTGLRFGYKDDPYCYISTIRQLNESFTTLNITTAEVLQYFIWKSLNPEMKSCFIAITNNNKPSLTEINEHIFTATERYMHIKKSNSNVNRNSTEHYTKSVTLEQSVGATSVAKSSNSYGRNSTLKTKYCTLCSSKDKKDETHGTFHCKKYPSAQDKLNRLKAIDGCCKCASLSHITSQCRFRFTKPCSCSQYHFTYLCLKDDLSSNKQASKSVKHSKGVNNAIGNKGSNVSSAGIFIGKTTVCQYGEETILPTFSRRLTDGSVVRGLKDSGCQPTFITYKAAKRLKLKTLEKEFPLSVNGFNSTENIYTKVVELPFSPDQPPIRAICIPCVRTNLQLPLLDKVVKTFELKGYSLADEFLTDSGNEICELDMVLGSNDSQHLPAKDICFGQMPCSMYSWTPNGVMLSGSIKRLLTNLNDLPHYDTEPLSVEVKSGSLQL